MTRPRETLFYFCDETSMHDQYMALGGLAIRASRLDELTSDILAINTAYHVQNEVKWATLKKRRQNVHRAYVDLLFTLIQRQRAHVHINFITLREYDHWISGPRKDTDTVSKQYYTLLLNRAGQFYCNHTVRVRPDNGDCTSYLVHMRGALNADIHGRFGGYPDVIRDVQCRDSSHEPMLQLLDVTLGALCAARNGRHLLPETSEAKRNLALHAFHLTGAGSLARSSPRGRRRLNIWNVRPKWGKRGSIG